MSKFGGSPYQLAQSTPSTVANFFEQRSFRRLVAILGIGTAVALAYSAFRKHLFPTESETKLAASLHAGGDIPVENGNNEEKIEPGPPEEVAPKPEVTLFQVPRGFFTPSVSPFGLKLETFLRVAKIDHEVEIITSSSGDGTETPWIQVGDKEVKSTVDCIKYLNNYYSIDLAADATSSRKTAARLVDTLFESRISWGIALWRWVYDGGRSLKAVQEFAPTGHWVLSKIKESVLRAANYQGMGKQSEEEVTATVVQGLIDAAAALGKHKYFLGSTPGDVDCHAFSLLAQMVWNMPGSPFEAAMKEQKTLMDYVLRMRDNYWPDWEDLVVQNKSVLPHPTTSSTFSPRNPSTTNKDVNEYSPPREVTLHSEKSLSRATTPSRSTSVGREASAKSSTNLVDTGLHPTGKVAKNSAQPVASAVSSKPTPSQSPVRKADGILKQPGISYKPLSANPLLSNFFNQQPQSLPQPTLQQQSQYNNHPQMMTPPTQAQYIPPPQIQRPPQPQINFQSSYLQTPVNYNNGNYPMGSTIPAQHQYYNNQQVGAGFMNNNTNNAHLTVSRAPQSQYGYSAPVKPSNLRDPYFDDLLRATEAVMRSSTADSNAETKSYWQ